MSGEGVHNVADDSDVLTAAAAIYALLVLVNDEVAGLDGAAMRGTNNAALAAIWIPALATALANYTAARAAYLDELAAANLPSDVDDLLYNIAVLFHHIHSRIRAYPQDVTSTITLVSNAAANTFGSWTEIIPINIVDFQYMTEGIVIEQVDAATIYFIQIGYSIVDGSDPTTAQILGERRIRLVTVPIARATEILELKASHCPANAKLWGRLKTASTNADEAEISVVVIRHTHITNHIEHLTTWPWST